LAYRVQGYIVHAVNMARRAGSRQRCKAAWRNGSSAPASPALISNSDTIGENDD
jgi:hypothetical protein